MMEWLVTFVKSKKWLNAVLAMVATYGGYLMIEAGKFDYFKENPGVLAVVGVFIGLFTRFYNEQVRLDAIAVSKLDDETIDEAVLEAFRRANK